MPCAVRFVKSTPVLSKHQNMKISITVANNAGSCFGVDRALTKVLEAANRDPLFTFGPLIHNPRVIAELEAQDIKALEEEDVFNLPSGARLVLRAHGTSPKTQQELKEHGYILIDATCPFVKKAQVAALDFSEKNYAVVIAGEKGHPEIESLLGFAPGAHVVSSISDVQALIQKLLAETQEDNKKQDAKKDETRKQKITKQKLAKQKTTTHKPIGLLSQTTQTYEFLFEVKNLLEDAGFSVQLANTICEATKNRQQDACALAKTVDVMIVLGGKNSANTSRLAKLCSEIVPTLHIEAPSDIAGEWKDMILQRKTDNQLRVGITAGASTPQSHIKELVAYLETH